MENEKIKTSRASSTRAKEAKKTTWTPPNSLDAPLRHMGSDTDGLEQKFLVSTTLKMLPVN